MILDLAPLTKSEASHLPFDFEFEQPAIDYYGDVYLFNDRVHVNGHVWRVDEKMLLELTIQTTVEVACARCLKNVREPVNQSASIQLIDATNDMLESEVDEDVEFVRGNKVDLVVQAQQLLFVSLPLKTLCQKDCQGICPQCGARIGTGDCHCDQIHRDAEETDPRLERLKEWVTREREE